MTHTGKCYCGAIVFEFNGPIHSQVLCYCSECRYFSGGEPNASIVISKNKFRVIEGDLKTFARDDLESPRVRYFCRDCGTHICVESPPRPGMLVLKVGTIDDHSWFRPEVAIFCVDKQPFHQNPEGCQSFKTMPKS